MSRVITVPSYDSFQYYSNEQSAFPFRDSDSEIECANDHRVPPIDGLNRVPSQSIGTSGCQIPASSGLYTTAGTEP